MAESVIDVIANRTRMAFVDPVGTLAILPDIVKAIGDRKGWNTARREAEDVEARDFLAKMTYGNQPADEHNSDMKRRRAYRGGGRSPCRAPTAASLEAAHLEHYWDGPCRGCGHHEHGHTSGGDLVIPLPTPCQLCDMNGGSGSP
ncbi:mitochondrial glycerol-3-phosphate dehydrogenase, partial [Perkinsus olseni]